MLSKNQFKFLNSLKYKKTRIQENKILIEGVRIIREAQSSNTLIDSIYYTDKFASNHVELLDILNNQNISMTLSGQQDIKKLSESKNNPGIIAVVNIKIPSKEEYVNNNQLIIDSVSDPGNLGNIMRSADWFGLKNIYLSENSVDPYNSKVVRSAMGAHFYLNIFKISIIDHIKNLKEQEFKIIGANIEGESLYNWNIPNKWALVLGNEAHGISDEVNKLVDYDISIPQKGNVESLNVSMAGGIILSHIISNKKDK
tara:strand:- start:202 stop:969 length:768 start_codon:yes stop_codon:yes gene_type:complete